MDTRFILFGFWVALMLIFLLGDVIRIFAGDFKPGKLMGKKASQGSWLLIAGIMLTPVVVAVLTLVLDQPAARMLNIIAALAWFLFNVLGITSYPGYYDRFLLLVSLGLNALTVWYAFNWM